MKNFKQVASFLLIPASLFSAATFAQITWKNDTLPANTGIHNWTGFYAGVNAGLVQHTLKMTDNNATSFDSTIEESANPQFTGGLQVGYRRQMDFTQLSGVYGLELSTNFSSATFDQTYGSSFSLYELSANNALKNIGLLQLTGGVAAGNTLLFLAAGVSWANITGHVDNLGGIPFFNSFNVGKKVLGSAIGGGIEYAFNEKISARFKADVITPNTYTVYDNVGDSFQISNSIVQGTLGINYTFG